VFNLTEVDKDNFEEEVRKSSLPVVVDIWSDKCEKCKIFGVINVKNVKKLCLF
jgi:thioredoxin-like negative regulator of GroEL